MKQNRTLREVALFLVSLAIIGLVVTIYYFNVPARRFVASLTEAMPSATPPPTYTPFPLPGTVLPYPAPTGQSTVSP